MSRSRKSEEWPRGWQGEVIKFALGCGPKNGNGNGDEVQYVVSGSIPNRLMKIVPRRPVEEHECWTVRNGYKSNIEGVPQIHLGQVLKNNSRDSVMRSIRRVMCAAWFGVESAPRISRMACGNPACVRPSHVKGMPGSEEVRKCEEEAAERSEQRSGGNGYGMLTSEERIREQLVYLTQEVVRAHRLIEKLEKKLHRHRHRTGLGEYVLGAPSESEEGRSK